MNEGLLDNVKLMEPYFFERLNEFNDYDHIGETRGIGLMAALEMVKNKIQRSHLKAILIWVIKLLIYQLIMD